jgi:hypothetical protein
VAAVRTDAIGDALHDAKAHSRRAAAVFANRHFLQHFGSRQQMCDLALPQHDRWNTEDRKAPIVYACDEEAFLVVIDRSFEVASVKPKCGRYQPNAVLFLARYDLIR